MFVSWFCANLCVAVDGCQEIEHRVYFMLNNEEMNLFGDNVTLTV